MNSPIVYLLTGKVAAAYQLDTWGELEEPTLDRDSWTEHVRQGYTQLGYWEWAQDQADAQANEELHTTNFPTP